jgi:hypothetical protein
LPTNSSHQRYLDLLFAHVRSERYPSHQMLARIESAITDRESAQRYVDVLLEAAESQRYPSLRMLDRAAEMVSRLVVADEIQRRDEELQDIERSMAEASDED